MFTLSVQRLSRQPFWWVKWNFISRLWACQSARARLEATSLLAESIHTIQFSFQLINLHLISKIPLTRLVRRAFLRLSKYNIKYFLDCSWMSWSSNTSDTLQSVMCARLGLDDEERLFIEVLPPSLSHTRFKFDTHEANIWHEVCDTSQCTSQHQTCGVFQLDYVSSFQRLFCEYDQIEKERFSFSSQQRAVWNSFDEVVRVWGLVHSTSLLWLFFLLSNVDGVEERKNVSNTRLIYCRCQKHSCKLIYHKFSWLWILERLDRLELSTQVNRFVCKFSCNYVSL